MIGVDNDMQMKCHKDGASDRRGVGGGHPFPPAKLYFEIFGELCHVAPQNDRCDSVTYPLNKLRNQRVFFNLFNHFEINLKSS